MEEVGWCASPRGCGPRTDVTVPVETVAPVVVEPDSGMVPPEMPVEDVPAYNPPVEEMPVENVHIESNGIAPAIQDATNKTIDHAMDSLFYSLTTSGIKFLIIAAIIIAVFMLIKRFMKTAAVKAQDYVNAQKAEALRTAREHAKVKEAIESKEKIERAHRKRKAEQAKSKLSAASFGASVEGFSLEDLTSPIAGVSPLRSAFSNYAGSGSVISGEESNREDDPFAKYSSDLLSTASSVTENSSNAIIGSPEKRPDSRFSHYVEDTDK